MNTIVININGTTINLTVKIGSTINIRVEDDKIPLISDINNSEIKFFDKKQTNKDKKQANKDKKQANKDKKQANKDKKRFIIEDEKSIGEDDISIEEDDISIGENEKSIGEDDISISSESEIETISESEVEINKSTGNDLLFEFCKEITPKKKYIKHTYQVDENKNYICPYCDYKTKKMNTVSMHVASYHSSEIGRSPDLYKCEIDGCEKGFPTNTRLQNHIKNMHVISYEKCPHIGCDYNKAKTSGNLITHYAKNHLDCESMYKSVDGMNICNNCNSSTKHGIFYHLAICNKASPFYNGKK
jgi:hypothetical protein